MTTQRRFDHPQGFTAVDNRIFYLQEVLTPNAFGILMRIYRMTEGFDGFPKAMSNTFLQKLCNISKNTVTKALKELEDLKLILVSRKKKETSKYLVNPTGVDLLFRQVVQKSFDGFEEAEEPKEEVSQDPLVEVETSLPFENFWNIYNKKVDTAKCRQQWGKMTLEQQNLAISHATKYVASTPDKQFRKNPLNYLMNQGWLDEVVQQPTASASAIPSQSAKISKPVIQPPEPRRVPQPLSPEFESKLNMFLSSHSSVNKISK